MKKAITLALFFLALGGCTYYLPTAVSSTGLGPKEIPIRMVSGHSSSLQILFFPPTGNDSLEAAVKNAVNGRGDSMANVFVDRKITYFPWPTFSLFRSIETSVYGTLIKYSAESGMIRSVKIETCYRTKAKIREVLEKLKEGTELHVTLKNGERNDGAFDGFVSGRDTFMIINTEDGSPRNIEIYVQQIDELAVLKE